MAYSVGHEPLKERVDGALISVNKLALAEAFETSGMALIEFAELILVPVLESIGDRWKEGDLSLAQVYMSGRMCEGLMDKVLPAGSQPDCAGVPMALAVLEDFHVLGKRIVCSVLRAAGYGFVDYGPVSLDELVDRVQQDNIRILMVSTLMLASALRVKRLRERLDALELDVRLVVGGAPFRFDPELYREVGADATSPTAGGVVSVIRQLLVEVNNAAL